MNRTLRMSAVLGMLAVMAPFDSAQNASTIRANAAYAQDSQAHTDLSFTVPVGWRKDEKAAKKMGLYMVLVPAGTPVETASAVITISFDKKDPKTDGLNDLKSYFAYDMRQTLAQAPAAKFARWQPSKLDPDKVPFMSIEIYGEQRNQPAPQHLLIVDSGDGFFSVALTVRAREDFQLPMYDQFFNGLGLTPRP